MRAVVIIAVLCLLQVCSLHVHAQDARSKVSGLNFGLGNHVVQQIVDNENAEPERGGGLNARLGYVLFHRFEVFVLGDISILNKPVQTDAFNHIGYGLHVHFNSDREVFRPYVGMERAHISNLVINGPISSLLRGSGYAATVGFSYFVYKQFCVDVSASALFAEYDRFRLNGENVSTFAPLTTQLMKLRVGFRVVL